MDRLEEVRKIVDATLLSRVRKIVEPVLLSQNNLDERRAGFAHLYGVAQVCTLLAMKRNLDVEICAVIGMLHDYSTYRYDDPTDHAARSAIEAEKILRELRTFDAEEIQLIANAIHNHSDKAARHDVYSELLKDADSFQYYLYNPRLNRYTNSARESRVQDVMKELDAGNDSFSPQKTA